MLVNNRKNEILVKRGSDIVGQALAIENCQNSLLIFMENLASITIDDCEDSVIILGPCQGSIFVRDTHRCQIFTACQQFRTRNSTITVHLFCSTAPIIEETKAQVRPLSIDYPHFEEHMKTAGLAGKDNLYAEVQDFTPDISELLIIDESLRNFDFNACLHNLDGVESVVKEEKITFL